MVLTLPMRTILSDDQLMCAVAVLAMALLLAQEGVGQPLQDGTLRLADSFFWRLAAARRYAKNFTEV